MRVWQIIFASAIAATIAGGAVAGWVVDRLDQHTEPAITMALYSVAPLIGSVWLGVYSVSALFWVSTLFARVLRQTALQVERSAAAIAADPMELARLLPPGLQSFGTALRGIVFRDAAEPHAALTLRLLAVRRQLRSVSRRLYFGFLARSQYATALALLLALSLIQAAAVLPLRGEPLRVLAAALPWIFLLLAAVLLWIAEYLVALVGIRPFVRSLVCLPIDSLETVLLRRLDEKGRVSLDSSAPSSLDEDRLRAIVDTGQQPVLGAVDRLANTLNGVNRSTRSDLENIKAALTELVEATRLGQNATRPSQQVIEELRDVVLALTETVATMNQPSSSLDGSTSTPSPSPASYGGASVSGTPASLLRELELLAREMDTDLPRSDR